MDRTIRRKGQQVGRADLARHLADLVRDGECRLLVRDGDIHPPEPGNGEAAQCALDMLRFDMVAAITAVDPVPAEPDIEDPGGSGMGDGRADHTGDGASGIGHFSSTPFSRRKDRTSRRGRPSTVK